MIWQFYVFYMLPGLLAVIVFIVGCFMKIWWLVIAAGIGVVIWCIVMWPVFIRLNSDV